MAKSLRSKLRRKHLAVRRDRNKPRELATLKKTLMKKNPIDQEMKDMTTVVDIKQIKSRLNPKTMKDKTSGQYPVWMSQREAKKLKKVAKETSVNKPKNIRKKDVIKKHKKTW